MLSFEGMRPKMPHSRPCVTALRTVAQPAVTVTWVNEWMLWQASTLESL